MNCNALRNDGVFCKEDGTRQKILRETVRHSAIEMKDPFALMQLACGTVAN